MTPKQILERIQVELPGLIIRLGKREPEAVIVLDSIHRQIYGVGFQQSCGDCINKAYYKLISLTLEQITKMTQKKMFVLKEGYLVEFPAFTGRVYDNASITDELAIRMIKSNENFLNNFESYPKDEKGNVLLSATPEKSSEKQKTAAQLKAEEKAKKVQEEAAKKEAEKAAKKEAEEAAKAESDQSGVEE